MNIPSMIGLLGAGIAGYAYLPQIIHLIKEKCSAGISQRAYALWIVSSILLAINAFYIRSVVFIVLGIIQLVSTITIFIFGSVHKNQVCEYHASLITKSKVVRNT
jgi:uncharacterized protein with PQ loop repeat